MKFSPYSLSKIESFKKCPRKFKYQYIDKVDGVQNKDAELGVRIHEMIAYDVALPGYQFDVRQHKTYGYKVIFPKDFKERKEELTRKAVECEPLSNEESPAVIAVGELTPFVRLENYRLAAKMPEIKLAATRAQAGQDRSRFGGHYVPCNYKDKEAIFRGVIDFAEIETIDKKAPITKDNIVNVKLIDWKTGKNPCSKVQLLFYAFLFGLNFDIPVTSMCAYYYYTMTNKTTYVQIAEDEVIENVRFMEDDIEKIELYDFTYPELVRTPLCNWCKFKKRCDEDSNKPYQMGTVEDFETVLKARIDQ